jgi:hypothetical protein
LELKARVGSKNPYLKISRDFIKIIYKYRSMKKLLTILALVALTISAVAQNSVVPAPIQGVSVDVGFASKLIEQGTVTGSDYITAGVGVDVYSVNLAIETFSRYDSKAVGKTKDASGLKRVYVNAGYVFTSSLANLTLGAQVRHAQGTETLVGGLTSDVLPFVKLNGKLLNGLVVWDGTVLADTKNHSNNYEANLGLPIGTQVIKALKVVPAVGVGFNDPGSTTIAALKANKKYATAGIGLAAYGVTANVFVHRRDVTSTNGQVTGYNIGYTHNF